MLSPTQFDIEIMQAAESIRQKSRKILKKGHLSALQREDLSAINEAIGKFIVAAQASHTIIISSHDTEEKKRVRHDLRNHLNIVVGFSSLIIKELPDNLLLYMISIRQIYQTGEDLIICVDNIQ